MSFKDYAPEGFTWGIARSELDDLKARFWTRYNTLTSEMKADIDRSNFHSRSWDDHFRLVIGFKEPVVHKNDGCLSTDKYHRCVVEFYNDHVDVDWGGYDASGENTYLVDEFVLSGRDEKVICAAFTALHGMVPNFNDTVMAAFEALLQMVVIQVALPNQVSPE